HRNGSGFFFFSGGGQKVIPMYKEPVNSPFVTREMRELENAKIVRSKPPQPERAEPLIDFKVYEQQAKPKEKQIDATTFLPHIVPNPYYGAGMMQWPYYSNPMLTPV